MLTYDEVDKFFHLSSCKLLTTREEALSLIDATKKKSIHHIRVRYIACCKHENYVTITNFLRRNTGRLCKECSRANMSNKVVNSKENFLEVKTINEIQTALSHIWNIKRTNEGCRADICIKPYQNDADEWMAIQLKTTKCRSHSMYSFRRLDKPYNGMLIICHCIDDDLFWIFKHDEIQVSTLNISSRSKYNSYLKDKSDIHTYLQQQYHQCVKYTLKQLLCPVNIYQQREQHFVQIRENLLSELKFSYPDVHYGKTDFFVNDIRFQEKVAGKTANREGQYVVSLYVNNGSDKKQRKYRCYKEGENDYYWVHLDGHSDFFVFPEAVLIQQGFISPKHKHSIESPDLKRKSLSINLFVDDWKSRYRYNFNNIDHLYSIIKR